MKRSNTIIIYFSLLLLCISSSCNDEKLNDAATKVFECSDVSLLETGDIDHQNDSVFFSGTVKDKIISIKPGFIDYKSVLVEQIVFSTGSNNIDINSGQSMYQIANRIFQESGTSGSFTGDHLFGFYLELPCSATNNHPVAYLDRLKNFASFKIRDQSQDCSQDISINLKFACYQVRQNGTGSYVSTPLTTESGPQIGHSFEVIKLDYSENSNGTFKLELEGKFSANLYFTTPQGGPFKFGAIRDGHIRIIQTLEP